MERMTLRQVDGYLNAPKRDLKRLALTARQAMLKADELAAEVRRLEERLAATDSGELVVMLHRDGLVEVFGWNHQRVRIVNKPDLGKHDEDRAEAWALERLPLSHRLLMESDKRVVVARGHTAGCMDRYRFQCLQADLDRLKAINELAKGKV